MMFLGVLFGALGSHALKTRILPENLQSFMIAIRYLLFHGIALISLTAFPYLNDISEGTHCTAIDCWNCSLFREYCITVYESYTPAKYQLVGANYPNGRIVLAWRMGLFYIFVRKRSTLLNQFFNVFFYGHCHRRRLFGWCFNVNTQFSIICSFYCGISINCNTCIVLLKVWEILEK